MECTLLFSAVHEGGHNRRKPLRSFAASVSVLRSLVRLHSISPYLGRGGSGEEEEENDDDDDDGDGGDEVLAFRFSVQIPPGQQSDPRLFSPTARCSFTTRVEHPAIPHPPQRAEHSKTGLFCFRKCLFRRHVSRAGRQLITCCDDIHRTKQ